MPWIRKFRLRNNFLSWHNSEDCDSPWKKVIRSLKYVIVCLKSQDSFWQMQNETEMRTQYYGNYEQESLIWLFYDESNFFNQFDAVLSLVTVKVVTSYLISRADKMYKAKILEIWLTDYVPLWKRGGGRLVTPYINQGGRLCPT